MSPIDPIASVSSVAKLCLDFDLFIRHEADILKKREHSLIVESQSHMAETNATQRSIATAAAGRESFAGGHPSEPEPGKSSSACFTNCDQH
jgi:hypothetical protein